MFFELNGNTYRIKFYRQGTATIAELFKVHEAVDDADKDGFISLGAYGIGRPHHTEKQFVKSVGRKAALSNLLKGLSDHVDEETGEVFLSEGPIVLTKEDREMIWAKYFETHKK